MNLTFADMHWYAVLIVGYADDADLDSPHFDVLDSGGGTAVIALVDTFLSTGKTIAEVAANARKVAAQLPGVTVREVVNVTRSSDMHVFEVG